MKKIWFVSDSEPIPELTGKGRLMRAGKLAQYAAELGNKVTWWSSTWLHYEERFYSNKEEKIDLNANLRLHLLHVKKAYKKHVSFDRIQYCKNIAREFRKAIEKEEKPDVIHCSWPLIELGYECAKYGRKYNIPVVLDIRDLWPDIFIQPFQGLMEKVALCGIHLLYGKKTRYAMKYATQIIGVTEDAVSLSNKWGRSRKEIDHVLVLAYQKRAYKESEIQLAEAMWNELGIIKGQFVVIYIGSIHFRNAQLRLVIDAAKQINNKNVKFVLCGKGPDYELALNETKELDNIVLPGYRNDTELYVLGKLASAGLLPYSNTPDFINALPNKLGEYLYYGIPVFTTLQGASKKLLEESNCGFYFNSCKELIQKIEQLESQEKVFKQMKENAHSLFEKSFDADVVYKDYCDELINI